MVGIRTTRPKATPLLPTPQMAKGTAKSRRPIPARPEDHVHLGADLRTVGPDVLRAGPNSSHSSAI